MKIAVWRTGHEIADTVASALQRGLPNADIRNASSPTDIQKLDVYDAHVAYGILRGCDVVFKNAARCGKPYFNLDRGYFNPNHFDGYYRISHKSTQAKWHENGPSKAWQGTIEPLRPYDASKPVLVCPLTEHVRQFFGFDGWGLNLPQDSVIRHKGDTSPLRLEDYRAVITFNSSVGWQALQKGIPVLSDPEHSVVGSFYGARSLEELLTDKFYNPVYDRKQLFDFMNAHQFTLAEIARGEAWPLIQHYLSSSDMMAGKPSQAKSPLIA